MKKFSRIAFTTFAVPFILMARAGADPEKPHAHNPPAPQAVVKGPQVKNKLLFSEDTNLAVETFDAMMKGEQTDWDDLITLMHYQARRYAFLMNRMNARNRNSRDFLSYRNYQGFNQYLYKRTEA